MPNADTQPLSTKPKRLGIGFSASAMPWRETDSHGTMHRYNVQTMVERDGSIVAPSRSAHTGSRATNRSTVPHAERYYFARRGWLRRVAAFGGLVGMMICNDRRGRRATGSWDCRRGR